MQGFLHATCKLRMRVEEAWEKTEEQLLLGEKLKRNPNHAPKALRIQNHRKH